MTTIELLTAASLACAAPGALLTTDQIFDARCGENHCTTSNWRSSHNAAPFVVQVMRREIVAMVWRVEVLGTTTTRWGETAYAWIWREPCELGEAT